MKKNNETVKVELKLVNDYGTGERNGEIKILECALSDKDNLEDIEEYILNHYELNLDDMWKIQRTYY